MASWQLILNADGTFTVRAGRYVEHVGADHMPVDLLDRVRYAALCAGVSIEEGVVWERIMELKAQA